jgi:iron(III) transport system substrate-binding protein
MKKIYKIIVFSTLLLSFCFMGCKKKASPDNSVIVASPHTLDFISPLLENFENETGIDVVLIQGGTGDLLGQLEESESNCCFDLLWGGSYSMVLPYRDLFADYISVNEPYMQNSYKNIEGSLTRFSDIPSVLMVNTKLLGNIKITGYEDLLNPELKGKIAFSNPVTSSSSWEHLINMVVTMGWDFVEKFCENLEGELLASSSLVYKGVAEGKYTIGLTFEDAAANYADVDSNITLVYMKEGVAFTPDGIYITKNTIHKENAERFVDYMTGKNVQIYMSQMLNRRSVRYDIDAKSTVPSKNQLPVIELDYPYLEQVKVEWLEHFTTLFNKALKNEKR